MTTIKENPVSKTQEELIQQSITYHEKYDVMRDEITTMCQDLERNLKKERDELDDVIHKTNNPEYYQESSFVPIVDTMITELEDTTLKDYANQSIFASIKDKMSEYKEHSTYVVEHPPLSKVDKKTMREMLSALKEIEEIERVKENEMLERHRKELVALRIPRDMISAKEFDKDYIKKLNKVDFNSNEINNLLTQFAYFVNDYKYDIYADAQENIVRNSPLMKEDAVLKLKELCKTLDMNYNNVQEPATFVELRNTQKKTSITPISTRLSDI